MAIPFTFPTQQDTDDNYQILDQLFEQLYNIVHQIIIQRGRRVQNPPPVPVPRNRTFQRRRDGGGGDRGGGGTGGPPPDPSVSVNTIQYQHEAVYENPQRQLPLPDVVQSATASSPRSPAPIPTPRRCVPAAEVPQPPPRRPRRRRPAGKRGLAPEMPSRPQNWRYVGQELKKIADEFQTTNPAPQEEPIVHRSTTPENTKKEQCLLSLLVPPPFQGSLWTAVIFLVGWRLLAGRVW